MKRWGFERGARNSRRPLCYGHPKFHRGGYDSCMMISCSSSPFNLNIMNHAIEDRGYWHPRQADTSSIFASSLPTTNSKLNVTPLRNDIVPNGIVSGEKKSARVSSSALIAEPHSSLYSPPTFSGGREEDAYFMKSATFARGEQFDSHPSSATIAFGTGTSPPFAVAEKARFQASPYLIDTLYNGRGDLQQVCSTRMPQNTSHTTNSTTYQHASPTPEFTNGVCRSKTFLYTNRSPSFEGKSAYEKDSLHQHQEGIDQELSLSHVLQSCGYTNPTTPSLLSLGLSVVGTRNLGVAACSKNDDHDRHIEQMCKDLAEVRRRGKVLKESLIQQMGHYADLEKEA